MYLKRFLNSFQKRTSNGNRNEPEEEFWHSIKIETVYEKLNVDQQGLSSTEAKKRLEVYGENKLPEGKKTTIWNIILHQLMNPLIIILALAALASISIGDKKDAIFIFIVIVINCALGAYQEYSAEKSASALQKLLKIKAIVKRDGKKQEVSSEELVPGDIVYLESGNKVPADIRFVETSNIEVDESVLTGESVAVNKNVGILPQDTVLIERTNMAFAGSTVISGRGKGVVVATGDSTQIGKIARTVSEAESAKPPLVLRMESFVKQVAILIIGISVVVAIILKMKGMDLPSIFFFAVALIVSAIPEGLPVSLTVALSIAARRMARRNVIVRKLPAVESLGSCTVIASDKTGTLTVNQQTARKIIFPDNRTFLITGQGYNGEGQIFDQDNPETPIDSKHYQFLEELAEIAVLSNEASLRKEEKNWKYHGDSMDVALLGMAYKLGMHPENFKRDFQIIDRIPYESERQFSAAFYKKNDRIFIGVKGAVEVVTGFCNRMITNGDIVPVNKELLLKQAENLSSEGYRVLAFARDEHRNFQKKAHTKEDIPPLVFYGMVCFIDPLRPESKEAIKRCKRAGIKVLMITGDHPATAKNIAEELKILQPDQQIVTGKMLLQAESSDGKEFEKPVLSTNVFARVSPVQKLQIVDVLMKNGEFVAVTGDGINDTPALKRANIGVAVGSGTDVAKEVSTMIIVDDNFASIVSGVEEGRYAYDNVRKVIYLLVSTGAAEVILFVLSVIAGLPLPLLAVQLLWLNLVTNGIQDKALTFEPGEPGTMLKKPRRPDEKIFNPIMVRQIAISSSVIAIITFCFWHFLINHTQMTEIHARNMVFMLMVFMENVHVFNCRSETISTFKIPLKSNLFLVISVLAAQGVHILSMHIPVMQNILKIEPITIKEWFSILVLAVPLILVMEIFKIILRRRSAPADA